MVIKKNARAWEDLIRSAPESYKSWLESEINYLKENVPKDASVLDVACGGGRILEELYDITENLIGIDHDEEAVKIAKENLKDKPNVKILLASAEKLPFENNSFDIALCIGSLTNFGDKKIPALREIKRVTKERGFMIISCYSDEAFEARMEMYKKIDTPIREIKGTTVIFDEDVGDNISEQFSREQLEEMFNEVGLEVLEIKKFGIGYDCKLRKSKK